MLTIGQLASAAGTTTRAVRHYHALGLLPEPARRANGYREYDVAAVLRLVRIRRLVGLGLSLPEVRAALDGADSGEVRATLQELVEDLRRQEEALRAQRERLTALLDAEQDPAVPDAVAGVLAEVRRLVPDEALVAREGELLELLEATLPGEQFAQLAQRYSAALADPDAVARSLELAGRFEALAAREPTDPEVEAVAAEMIALARDGFGDVVPEPTTGGADPVFRAYVASLPPAQQRCLALLEQEHAR